MIGFNLKVVFTFSSEKKRMNHHESLGHSMEISTTSLLLQQVRKRTYTTYVYVLKIPGHSGFKVHFCGLLFHSTVLLMQ